MSYNQKFNYYINFIGQNNTAYVTREVEQNLAHVKSAADSAAQSFQSLKAATQGSLSGFGMPDWASEQRKMQSINAQSGLGSSAWAGSWGTVDKYVRQNTKSMNQLVGSMGRTIFSAQMSLFYIGMLTSNMNRNENATLQLEGAQQRLSEALRTSGRNSTEYRNALRAVEIAQNNLNSTTLQANVLNVAMGLNMVQMGVSIYSSLPALRQLITALKSYNVVATISQALTPGAGWIKLAAGLAIGTAATGAVAYMMNQGGGSSKPSVTVNNESYSAIEAYLSRKGKTAVEVAG
jgi:hypothetical protein